MAKKSKSPARVDLKNPYGKFGRLIQIGGTAIVVIFAVGLVAFIVKSGHDKKASEARDSTGQGDTVRVTTSKLVTKPGTADPKAVVTLYEDFLCPNCGAWEQEFGSTVSKLIDIGAIAAEYSMLAILDSPKSHNYSSRAGGAALCVADEGIDLFRRFHSELYDPNIQPSEKASSFPDNAWLIERARQVGINVGPGSKVVDCINSGKYAAKVAAEAELVKVFSTPTIKINGEEYSPQSPQDLVAKVKSIVGDVPGIETAAPPPAP
ncbi:MAG: hypothetical protein QOH91_2293 [Mycobacterium sp.]|nr:hypothetical protein [Mycobacterium sp.]